jgi:hypothetical protein
MIRVESLSLVAPPARSVVPPVLSAGADGARRHAMLAGDNPVNRLVARGRPGAMLGGLAR